VGVQSYDRNKLGGLHTDGTIHAQCMTIRDHEEGTI